MKIVEKLQGIKRKYSDNRKLGVLPTITFVQRSSRRALRTSPHAATVGLHPRARVEIRVERCIVKVRPTVTKGARESDCSKSPTATLVSLRR